MDVLDRAQGMKDVMELFSEIEMDKNGVVLPSSHYTHKICLVEPTFERYNFSGGGTYGRVLSLRTKQGHDVAFKLEKMCSYTIKNKLLQGQALQKEIERWREDEMHHPTITEYRIHHRLWSSIVQTGLAPGILGVCATYICKLNQIITQHVRDTMSETLQKKLHEWVTNNVPAYEDLEQSEQLELRNTLQLQDIRVTVMEKADYTFMGWLRYQEPSVDCIKRAIFQIFFTLASIKHKFPSFRHNDLHEGNIMMIKNQEPTNEIYIWNGKKFYIPSYKYTPVIIDFGLSSMDEFYNTRVARSKYGINFEQDNFYDIHTFLNKLRKVVYRSTKLRYLLDAHKRWKDQELRDFMDNILIPSIRVDDPRVHDRYVVKDFEEKRDWCKRQCAQYVEDHKKDADAKKHPQYRNLARAYAWNKESVEYYKNWSRHQNPAGYMLDKVKMFQSFTNRSEHFDQDEHNITWKGI
jgi:hypothetical protein